MKEERNTLLIKSLFGRADVLTVTGKYQEAIRDFKRIRCLSRDYRKRVKALIGLGNIYLTTGDTKSSSSIFRSALRTAKRKGLSIEKGSLLNCLANVKIIETEIKAAKRYANQALAVYRGLPRKRKERRRGIAESINNLGGIYSAEGRLSLALEHYMKSLKERRSIEDKAGKAIILNNIGVTFMDMRNLKKALEFLKKSLLLRREMGFLQGIALCLSNIGIVYWKQKRYDDALKCFQDNIKMQRMLGDKKGLSTSLSNLGVAHKTRGAYKDATMCHEESLRIRKKMGDRFGMTINLNQLGWIYLTRGDYKNALSVNREEKEVCDEIENLPRFMNYYNLHGNLLVAQKRYNEGYRYIEKSLEISRKLHLEIDEACELHNLGDVVMGAIEEGITTLGTVKTAKGLFEKGKNIAKKHDNELIDALFLEGFSLIDLMEGRFSGAMKKIEEAEKIVAENNFLEKLPSVLYLKARILLRTNKKKESKSMIIKAEKIAGSLCMKPILEKIKKVKAQYKIKA